MFFYNIVLTKLFKNFKEHSQLKKRQKDKFVKKYEKITNQLRVEVKSIGRGSNIFFLLELTLDLMRKLRVQTTSQFI